MKRQVFPKEHILSTNVSGSPVLSLLIPIYNVQRYLRECLDSALAQTLKDI